MRLLPPAGRGTATRTRSPPLAGQYTVYLWRQVDKYIGRQRIHDDSAPEDELLGDFSREELRDILAYLSALDD